MARKPRIHIPGGFYHIILLGNACQPLFFEQADREKFERLLKESVQHFECRLQAFCLMTDHVHLLLQAGERPLTKIIQSLSFRYTRFINKKLDRQGHLFQGRYKAVLIDPDSYLLELVRYIHNAPVRAGMVEDPVDYPWSSHRAYLDLEEKPFLTREQVLDRFGEFPEDQTQYYLEFMTQKENKSFLEKLCQEKKDSRILGEESFIKQVLGHEVQDRPVPLRNIIRTVCKHYGLTEQDLKDPGRERKMSEARGVIGWLATRMGSASLTEVTSLFGRDITTLSRIVTNINHKKRTSKEFRETLENLKKSLQPFSKT